MIPSSSLRFGSIESMRVLSPDTNLQRKRKYKQMTITDKLQVIKRINTGMKNKAIAAEFGVSHSTISYIMKYKESIEAQSRLLEEENANRDKTRIDAQSALDKVVYSWFKQKMSLGECVNGPLLKEKALIFNERLGGSETFKASSGWTSRFTRRYGLRPLAVQGEKDLGYSGGSNSLQKTFHLLVNERGYDPDNIYNADETGLAWKSLPRKCFAPAGESRAPQRRDLKNRLTVLTCTNATGTHRIPLLVIGKSKKLRCFENVRNIPVVYRSQHSGWIDGEIFEEWYKAIFLPSVKERKSGEDQNFILLLDNAPAHLTLEKLNSIDPNCTAVYLPPNLTALIQPMDRGVIEAVKKAYKKNFLRELLLRECTDNTSVTDFLKKWTVMDCCKEIAAAWNSLSEATLKDAWRLMSNGDDAEFDVRSEPVDELTSLLNRISKPNNEIVSSADTEAWLQEDAALPVWQAHTDEQILAACDIKHLPPDKVKREEAAESEEEREGEDDEVAVPTAHEVLAAMKTLSRWYDTRWECDLNDCESLHKMREVAANIILQLPFSS